MCIILVVGDRDRWFWSLLISKFKTRETPCLHMKVDSTWGMTATLEIVLRPPYAHLQVNTDLQTCAHMHIHALALYTHKRKSKRCYKNFKNKECETIISHACTHAHTWVTQQILKGHLFKILAYSTKAYLTKLQGDWIILSCLEGWVLLPAFFPWNWLSKRHCLSSDVGGHHWIEILVIGMTTPVPLLSHLLLKMNL